MCSYTTTINENGEFFVLFNPAILIPGPEGKLMFAKWLPYMKQDDGITIKKDYVIFMGEPMEDLKDHYMSVIVNKMFVPSKKIATPDLKLALD